MGEEVEVGAVLAVGGFFGWVEEVGHVCREKVEEEGGVVEKSILSDVLSVASHFFVADSKVVFLN